MIYCFQLKHPERKIELHHHPHACPVWLDELCFHLWCGLPRSRQVPMSSGLCELHPFRSEISPTLQWRGCPDKLQVLLHTQVPLRLEWFTQQCSGHKGVLRSQERYPLFMLLQFRQPIWRCHFHKKAWPNGYLPLFMLAFTDFARWCPDWWD